MKYFLDSAKIEEIKFAYDTFKIDGITTNPKHIEASGKPFLVVIQEIANWANEKGFKDWEDFPISVEINPHLDHEHDMVEEALKIAKIAPYFVIKIPCNLQGLTAARKLEEMGVRTNVTLVFSPSQALPVAKNGSLFVSPFVGWKENSGENCEQYIKDIVDIYRTYDYKTEIIVAALRNGNQIVQAAKAGADIVTCGLQVYLDSFEHPFTNHGLGIFKKAWDQTSKQ
ncbi:MAG: transaldolase [Clostridia bacterium]|jgi:transaldolase|nr:transaldolase [Clostridia bacterium]